MIQRMNYMHKLMKSKNMVNNMNSNVIYVHAAFPDKMNNIISMKEGARYISTYSSSKWSNVSIFVSTS